MNLSPRHERFLKGLDTCRIATIDPAGYPHCVPVGYFYYDGTLYIPTVRTTRKARNLMANPKCSVVVDVVEGGKGRGLMLQGLAEVASGPAYAKAKRVVEQLSGWHLDKWEIGGSRPDSIIEFSPERVVEIGAV